MSITRQETTQQSTVYAGGDVPPGGVVHQVLRKSSSADFATEWANPYGKGISVVPGVPSGGDDSAVLQAALSAVGDDGALYLPPGTWRANNLKWSGTRGLNIIGSGSTDTYLRHVPTTDGDELLRVVNGAGAPATHCRLSNIGIFTTDAIYDKTGLVLQDVSQFILENVNITGFGGANTDSVGLHTLGRQSLWARNVRISANIPVRIGTNPNTTLGYLSADHFTFTGSYLTCMDAPSSLTRAAVLIDGTAHVSQLQFNGGAWRLANADCYGLHWSMAANVNAYNSGLALRDVRTESGGAGHSTYSVYIKATQNTPLRQLTIENCEFDVFRNGYYCRYVDLIDVRSTILSYRNSGVTIPFDVDNMRAMGWDRVWTFADCKPGTMGAAYSLIDQTAEAVNYTYPHTGVWGRVT